MSFLRLNARDRKAVLTGAMVLAPGLAWAFGVRPYLDAVADTSDRVKTERALLERELELVASARRHPEEFRAGAGQLLEAAPRLVGGGDDGAAAAALAGYLRRLAGMSGATLASVEPTSTRDAGGGVTALPVTLSGEADLEAVLSFLRLLETGPKLVQVRELRLESRSRGTPAAGAPYATGAVLPATAAREGPESISFRFVATGFTLAAADTARRAAQTGVSR
jgi:hypothetical protein